MLTYGFSIDGDPVPPWTRQFSDSYAVWRYVSRFMCVYGAGRVYYQRVL